MGGDPSACSPTAIQSILLVYNLNNENLYKIMKDVISVDLPGFKAKYNVEWFDSIDFSKLENIKQVYGVIFNNQGELLIVNTVGNWQLPGGKPEKGESIHQTLHREVREEASVEINELNPLGNQLVSEIKEKAQGSTFCQIRIAAKIKKINPIAVDPATGKVPERKFIKVSDFIDYCPWGKIGQHVVDKAHATMGFKN